jgi:quercetin dioxygenase-like cupin family protein
MRILSMLCGVALCVCFVPVVSAQDATKVASQQYTVVSENNQVRILKVHYGPHEKSAMHSHPASVVVFLTNGKSQFTSPDGKTQDVETKAGEALYEAPTTHSVENLGDTPTDAILVELKGKSSKTAKMAKK